jgi:hypothetical protein
MKRFEVSGMRLEARSFMWAAALGVASALVGGTGPPAGAAALGGSTAQPALVKTAHVAFGSCSAADVKMRVSVPKLTFGASQPVTIAAVVHNVGATTCDYSGGVGEVSIGPCGPVFVQVDNSKGVDVWPGSAPYACPAELAAQLRPGAKVTANGSWDQTDGSTNAVVPRGSYRLIVGGKISFRLILR